MVCRHGGGTRAAAATKVIDRHQQPEDWPDFMYSDTGMSSTCQMIYELWIEWTGPHFWIRKAPFVYTGIVTDTGSFNTALPVLVRTR